MPDRARIQHAAYMLVTRCLALPAGSELAIVADETTLPIVHALTEAAESLDHRTHVMYFHSSVQREFARRALGESVKAALRDVAGTALCVNGSSDCLPFRESIRRAAWDRGRKVAHMPGANWNTLLAADTDYDELSRICEQLAWALAKGREIQITSFDRAGRAHTLTADLSGWDRMPIISDGIIADGAWGNVPSGETYIAPLEGSAEGEIVIDGSLPRRVLWPNEELVLRFEKGRLVSIQPEDSQAYQHLWNSTLQHACEQNDPNWNNLAEIGLGANRRIRRLTGVSLLDEKKFGTVHIAMGDNMDMGGALESLIHCDMVCLRPEVTIDGKRIMSAGRITLDESDWLENYRALELPDEIAGKTHVVRTGVEARSDGHGRLCRQWDTSSGRRCSIPVGDQETAIRAAGLWRAIRENGRSLAMSDLFQQSRESSERDFWRLLLVLELYELIHLS